MTEKPSPSSHSNPRPFQTVGEMLDHELDRKLYDTADKCLGTILRAQGKELYREMDSITYLMEPHVFDVLCEFLARGGTVRELILKMGINVHDFYDNLHKRPNRLRLWQTALIRREETIREAAISTHFSVIDADIRDLFDEDGGLVSIRKLPGQVARAIKKINYNKEGGIASIELFDKQRSADSLRKALLIEKNAGKGDELHFAEIIRKAEARAAKQRDKKERVITVENK